VVVNDLDMGWALLGPYEADAPLVVNADGVLSSPISMKGFKPVRRRHAQVAQVPRLVQHIKLSGSSVTY
jgi:hypothetical protein